jgi:hypothetical protein
MPIPTRVIIFPTLKRLQSPEKALSKVPRTIVRSRVSKAASKPIRLVITGAISPLRAKPSGGSMPRKAIDSVDSSKSSRMKGIIGDSEETAVRRFNAISSIPESAKSLPASGFFFN